MSWKIEFDGVKLELFENCYLKMIGFFPNRVFCIFIARGKMFEFLVIKISVMIVTCRRTISTCIKT